MKGIRVHSVWLVIISVLFCLSQARADITETSQMPDLAESVKSARIKSLKAEQINGVQAIAKTVLEANLQQASQDPRNKLAVEVEAVYQSLIKQRRARQNTNIKIVLDSSNKANGVSANTLSNNETHAISDISKSFRSKRMGMLQDSETAPQLEEALGKAEALESELDAIASQSAEEQNQNIDDLISRLNPHRASEFSASIKPQPTLIIGYPKPDSE